MRKRLMLATVLWLASSVAPAGVEIDGPAADHDQQDASSTKASDQNTPKEDPPNGGTAGKNAADGGTGTKKKADRDRTPKKKPDRNTKLAMEPGIVCKSIDGYESYEPLPGAAQTSEEKLLVYTRPLGYQTEKVDGAFEGHLTADFEVRKRGEKAVLRQKKKMLEYKPRAASHPRFIYLKSEISLKGLAPGDYDLTIILHDEIAKGSPVSQVIKFKVIPSEDPSKK